MTKKIIEVRQSVTAANDSVAEKIRKCFDRYGIWVLNLISSPGAGKTSLIEKTIEALSPNIAITVIEGDPYTSMDSDRINAAGARGIQINTHGGCHLDARMIENALCETSEKIIDFGTVDMIIIENVGNLLCPAVWDLGQDNTTVVTSLTEGSDKPFKYPETFIRADTLVINKMDLKPYLPPPSAELKPNAMSINPALKIFELSCTNGDGLSDWYEWVKMNIRKKKTGIHAKA
ncbi:Hydrogenase accessory protein HypB [Desulfamplus magnetovallimortis]|uniref:Hydrogenase accessory protein HypB n=1 Tax=Desulfamplus magnetovallimortis TaxID=1246637 RepID=A0A1W1HBH6_9BACT|nr:hydrogenase nickel incorporation protein HypB [Desulfamplus magnetovallimortis]SLM29851.1 Hydrogenase accessory protein HypB [Desulfamplus magnetovallimortis]